MDAIDFLRKEYSVTGDTMLVDAIGVNMKLDIVIRLMDKYADTKQKLNIHGVMQAEESDVSEGAAVASSAVGKGVCDGVIHKDSIWIGSKRYCPICDETLYEL